ncbi:MAG: hypothetical protein ACKOWG_03210, partial [Planctomycetia bacterium]
MTTHRQCDCRRVWNILAVACCLACCLAGAAAEAAPRPPSVLVILSDDQRADTIHALGNDAIRTP